MLREIASNIANWWIRFKVRRTRSAISSAGLTEVTVGGLPIAQLEPDRLLLQELT